MPPFRGVLGEIEDRECDLAASRVYVAQLCQRLFRLRRLGLELVRLGLVDRFVDRAREVGVQEAVLHGRQFGLPLGMGRGLPPPVRREIGDRVTQAAAEPCRQLWLEAHLGQVVDDRLLELVRLPTDGWVVRARVVVGAPVIDVLVDAAPFELAADAFARDRLAAVLAPEQTPGERVLGSAGATVLPIQHVLAGVEGWPVDQTLVLPLEDLPVAVQFADVEAVAEDVRKRCAVEPGLARTIDVTLALEHVGERLEGVAARGVEIEHADQCSRLLGMRVGPARPCLRH